MTTRGKAIIVLLVSGLAMSGCGIFSSSDEEYDVNIDTGHVTEVKYEVKSKKYKVTVLEDDAEYDSYKVSSYVARKCTVGKRWPDCKR
jgi:hypothetical protein